MRREYIDTLYSTAAYIEDSVTIELAPMNSQVGTWISSLGGMLCASKSTSSENITSRSTLAFDVNIPVVELSAKRVEFCVNR